MTFVRARALCFPSYDVGFARVVEAILAQEPTITPPALQTRLRHLSPATIVRARELSGERDQTFYIFRDGRWARGDDQDWWQGPNVGNLTIATASGTAVDVDQAFLDLIGAERAWVVGRRYDEFVVPQARIDSEVLYRTVLDGEVVRSVARINGPDDRGVTVEFRAERTGEDISVAVRSAFLAQGPANG